MAKRIFDQMTAPELGDAIDAILSARHQFNILGAYASAGVSQPKLQEWANSHLDRLESELRAACIAYVALNIEDRDEALTRVLSICGAYNWIPNMGSLPQIRAVIRPLQAMIHAQQ
jgi:hypothetical protein